MASRLRELAGVFLKLGTISFGGPAAHIALMEEEFVRRRKWLSPERFLDLFGATHLIPGPNAVEMAAHVGYRRAGFVGALVGGLSFTLPAVLIAIVCAIGYVEYGSLPQVQAFLYGVKPAILAIIIGALYRLGKKALTRWELVLVGVGVAGASLYFPRSQISVLLAGSFVGFAWLSLSRRGPTSPAKKAASAVVGASVAGSTRGAFAAALTAAASSAGSTASSAVSVWKLGLFFLKVGALLYGGGYVLLAYIEGGLTGPPWGLSRQQLLDAWAIGHLTPGPLLSTVTFVGYLVAGLPGAIVATAGFLIPSFCLVAIVNPWIPRLRNSPVASRLLDAVNAASIGLMGAVAVKLFGSTLFPQPQGRVDWPSALMMSVAATAALRWRVSPVWLVLAGVPVGWLFTRIWPLGM